MVEVGYVDRTAVEVGVDQPFKEMEMTLSLLAGVAGERVVRVVLLLLLAMDLSKKYRIVLVES
jgi:hypothetical protein